MNGTGTVEAIHITPEAAVPMKPKEEVEAVAGEGLRGAVTVAPRLTTGFDGRISPNNAG